MDFYDIFFFTKSIDSINAHMTKQIANDGYVIDINKSAESKHEKPAITIFVENFEQLTHFVHSVVHTYRMLKREEESKDE